MAEPVFQHIQRRIHDARAKGNPLAEVHITTDTADRLAGEMIGGMTGYQTKEQLFEALKNGEIRAFGLPVKVA